MEWPLITKTDVFSLCEPFECENSNHSRIKNRYAGVVFFDVGSVLIDLDWESYFNAVSGMAPHSHKFSIEKFKEIIKKEKINPNVSQGKLSIEDFIYKSIQAIKLSCENSAGLNISHHHFKYVDSLIVGHVRPKVLEVAKKLRDKNFIVGLLSNTTPWHVSLIYEKIQVTQNFDVNIFSTDAGYEKPHERIYEIAHEQACEFVERKFNQKLEKKDVYFVDDTPVNIHQAISFGWNARLVNLLKSDILNKLKRNEIDDVAIQQASKKRENLLFGEPAAQRVEELFGKLLA
ncbi:MAG: HAD family hydrolase [Bdellovibrionota bacterium]